MRPPLTALPSEIDQLRDRPAVFLLWAASGPPYLAKTTLLRRRLRRLLASPDRVSRVLKLGGIAERIEYWPVGSQLEAMLVHLELARQHFPDDWPKITRLHPPAFVRLTLHTPFPRTMITSRLGRGLYYGPFASRAAAERFEAQVLDLFQLRRCEEVLDPAPEHPGCIYGEMNRCLRPCQAAVSQDEYRHEAERFAAFLSTDGASLAGPAEAARDRASVALDFEEAERLHQRLERIHEAAKSGGEIARTLDRLYGVAVAQSADPDAIELIVLARGHWCEPRQFSLTAAGSSTSSMDQRLKEVAADIPQSGEPNLEHLSILTRWHGSSWRDGEWFSFDAPDKVPYRKLVNAINRVAAKARAPQ